MEIIKAGLSVPKLRFLLRTRAWIVPKNSIKFESLARSTQCPRRTLKEDVIKEDNKCPKGGHDKNKRPFNREKHEKGDSRRKGDQGGKKGDIRRPYRR